MGLRDLFKRNKKTEDSRKIEADSSDNGGFHPIPYEDLKDPSSRDFKYLNYLIHNGEDKITLDSDIVFDESEINLVNGIPIDRSNLVIDGGGYSIDAKGKATIFNITASNVHIRNVTLKNSYNWNTQLEERGGGAIFNSGDSVEFEYCIFENNHAENHAGAVFNNGKQIIFNNCRFENNSSKYGGAILSLRGNLILKDCIFVRNHSEEYAGAIHSGDTVNALNCIFDNNDSDIIGGAVVAENGRFDSYGCEFENNVAKRGGGFFNLRANTHLDNTNFENNRADEAASIFGQEGQINIESCNFENEHANLGGSISNRLSSLSITDSKFKNNAVDEDGGAIRNDEGRYDITNCIFEMCRGNYAGAISNKLGNVNIKNSDFIGNFTEIQGGAIVNERNMGVIGSTFDGNSSNANGGGIYNRGGAKLRIADSTFKNNNAHVAVDENGEFAKKSSYYPGYGGAICNNASTISIDNCDFEDNKAIAGGGIFEEHGNVVLKDSNFRNNIAILGGAPGFVRFRNSFKYENCRFDSNVSGKGHENDIMFF